MKKLVLLCTMVATLCSLAFAEYQVNAPGYETAKERYYQLVEKIVDGTATYAEAAELSDLCQMYGFDVPVTADPEAEQLLDLMGERERDNLDQGKTDTLSPYVDITCDFTDTGFFDGDNECSVISASPYNEVYFRFAPPYTRLYQMRARSYTTGVAAIRVLRGAICAGALAVTFSSGSVAMDCKNPIAAGYEPSTVVTYLWAYLRSDSVYYIHVGTSSSTVSTAAYEFNLWCIPCPLDESTTLHNTCPTAQEIACNDSILGDSASITLPMTPDWYKVVVPDYSPNACSLYVFVGAREMGHCISGMYPNYASLAPFAVDGRYTLYKERAGEPCGVDSVGYSQDDGCSVDARKTFAVDPGTYYIKVWNSGTYSYRDYVLLTNSIEYAPPCASYTLCGSPGETEPNNTCPVVGQAEITCDTTVYGLHCPFTDVDFWKVTVAPMNTMTLRLYSGPNCDVNPAVGVMFRYYDGACANVGAGSSNSLVIFNTTASPLVKYVEVYDVGQSQTLYKIAATCFEIIVDMGDLPMCNYPTLVNNPGHLLSGIAWLGDNVTGEAAPYPVNFDPADDGVTFVDSPWVPCHMESVTVIVTGGLFYGAYADTGGYLYLNAWKDGNLDGDFCDTLCDGDAPEWFLQNVIVVPGVYGFRVHDPGLEGGPPYRGVFRFRLTSRLLDEFGFGLVETAACPGMTRGTFGLDFLGEVEDYSIEDFQLAVEMGSFDAIPGDNRVTLRWNTVSETNSDRFEIVRDGRMIGRVAGAGTSPSRHDYSWTEEGLNNGMTYSYTLRSVDINGRAVDLATVSAAPSFAAGEVTEYALHQNYPNPFNPVTTIAFDLLEAGNVSLKIFNLVGQEVRTVVSGTMPQGRQVVSFDAGNLSSGIYLYRIEVNGFAAEKKMLLMK